MNPDPFTLRELTWMVEGRGQYEWQMTASMMALQINMNRKKGTKAVKANELNPFNNIDGDRCLQTLTGKAAWDMFHKVFASEKK